MTTKTRLYAFAAAAWAAFYLVAYLVIAHRDGNGIAWWYVGLVAAAVGLTVAAGLEGATRRGSNALLGALVVLVFSALLGIATIGLLLVPAIAAAGIAVGAVGRRPAAR